MWNGWRTLLIRTAMPLSWRSSPRRAATLLHRFAEVEADSGWQFMRSLEVVSAPEQRAALFLNALEEQRHAAAFAALARKRCALRYWEPGPPRQALSEREEDLASFLAHVHVGERSVYEQFQAYAHAAGDEEARALFTHIRADEAGHHDVLHQLLLATVGSEHEARRRIRRARRKRLYEAWNRGARAVGDTFFALWLLLLYALMGPLVRGACRRRLSRGATARPVPSREETRHESLQKGAA